MKIRVSISVNNAESMTEAVYSYEIELPDKTPLGEVEGHVETALRLLDKQASDSGEEDDEGFTAG